MKRAFALILSIVMLLALFAGCDGSETAEAPQANESTGSKPLVGVCMQSMSQSIYVMEAEALEETLADCDVQIASCDDDVSTQIQQINNFALLGADMIIIMPTEIEALTDAIQNAHDAGCKILINGSTGDSGALDGYYDTCTVSDEYLIGATVSMVAKKWAEQHLDPDGDWEVAFLICTLSDDTINRSNGLKSVLEEYLKNANGEYVDAMGNVVDEANRVPNPNYSELIASHYKGMEVEQDMAQSNYTTISNVMTQDANVRLFICYNSLASTEGGQYIVDNYEDHLDEFGFFSAGVMGSEADYMVGSLGHGDGTLSVFRGACEFGGGDVAGELAALAYNVMYGEAGVDYAVQTPQGIGQWWSVDADWSGDGTAYLANKDIQNAVTVQDFDPIAELNAPATTIYWDSANGYNEAAVEENSASAEITSEEPVSYDLVEGTIEAGTYTCEEVTPYGFTVNWTVTLHEDGAYEVLEENPAMGDSTYTGDEWTDNGDGTFTTGPMNEDARPMAGWFDADGTGHWGNLGDGTVIGIEDGSSSASAASSEASGEANYTDGEYVVWENCPYGDLDAQTFNAKVKGADARPVLFVVPGGAFRFVDNGRLSDIYDYFVEEGYLVVQLNYTTGEGTYPQAIVDVKSSIQYVVDNADVLHADVDNMTVLGCSAGGYLGAMAVFTDSDEFKTDSDYTYSIENFVDFFGATQWMTEAFLVDEGSAEYAWIGSDIAAMADELNPLNYLTEDDPVEKIWVSHGTADTTIDPGQSEQFFNGCVEVLGEDNVHFEAVDGAAHEGAAFYTAENFSLVNEFISG